MRVFVCLFVCAMLADLALDRNCDLVPASREAGATLTASGGGASDACARVCVPDCFCCSRSETASPALTLPALPALAQAPSPNPASVPAVVRPVAEPPPLALS